MDQYDALILVAELALGISGFSGVVVALGTNFGDWAEVDRLRLAALLAAGIGALCLVLISLLLIMLNVDGDRVWRISSLIMAVHHTGVMFTIVPRAWSITRDTAGMKSPYSVFVFIPVVVALCVNIFVQLVNASGILTIDTFGIFFAGLVLLLLISGTQFLRLLFVERRTDQ